MKIALIGYGKMGKMVENIAKQREHEIVSIIKNPNDVNLNGADVCIDFSCPGAIFDNVKKAADSKANLVIGTTGWESGQDQVEKMVAKYQLGCVHSPNFSIGVQLFMQMVQYAAALMDQYDQYDVSGFEMHHQEKKDSPSGTARALAKCVLKEMQRKDKAVYHLDDRKREKDELHFSSVRCGEIAGTHSVIFDSFADSITLTHEAKNRTGFALGAVVAAELVNKRKGFFTFEELIKR